MMAVKKKRGRPPKKKAVEKKPEGRPTIYSLELSDSICSRLAQGESMRSVSRDNSMPCMATMFRWLRLKPEFLEHYERAKEESADALVDEMIDIADDGVNDWMEKLDKNQQPVGWQLNGEHVQRSRLRLDTRKWIASRLKAKKYGDKIENTVLGDEEKPLQVKGTIDPKQIAEQIKDVLTSGSE